MDTLSSYLDDASDEVIKKETTPLLPSTSSEEQPADQQQQNDDNKNSNGDAPSKKLNNGNGEEAEDVLLVAAEAGTADNKKGDKEAQGEDDEDDDDFDGSRRYSSFWEHEIHDEYYVLPETFTYKIYHAFSFFAAFLAACMLCLQIMSFSLLRRGNFFTDDVCRTFVMILCLLFMAAELPVTAKWMNGILVGPMHNWVWRGFLYCLAAAMSAQVAQSSLYHTHEIPTLVEQLTVFFTQCNAAAVFAIGCIYFFMGFFCLKGVIEKTLTQYEEALAESHHQHSGKSSRTKAGSAHSFNATATAVLMANNGKKHQSQEQQQEETASPEKGHSSFGATAAAVLATKSSKKASA